MSRRKNNRTQDYLRQYLIDNSEPVTESGCWIWVRGVDNRGYGSIMVAGRNTRTHRVSYGLFIGGIPEGMHVLHRCDVPSFINPAHLFLGNHLDNMRDMNVKGRQVAHKGEGNGMAKLTEARVLDIRSRYHAGGVSMRALAEEFGVSKGLVSHVVNRLNWKHI